jgi:hypothetical protein
MNTLHWEDKDFSVSTSPNELIVSKKKRFKRNQIFLLLLFPISLGLLIFLFTKYAGVRINNTTTSYILIVAFSIYFIAVYINVLRQTIYNLRNFVIRIENLDVYINNSFLCDKKDIDAIIIQPSFGSNGLGMSYTIGIKTKSKSHPILHFLGEKDSNSIAKLLADFLQIQFATKKPLLFRSLSKW